VRLPQEVVSYMQFIDIHTHLIPHWDDGAEDWDVSLEMLRQGEEDGITQVVCTPHVLSQNDLKREEEIVRLFEELQQRAKKAGIKVSLSLGSEIYIHPDIDLNRKIATLAQNGRYFLVEFPMNQIPDFMPKRFFDFVMKDKIPVIAHPERNAHIIIDPNRAFDFVQRGALLQVNAGSLLGVFGQTPKAVAMQLMNANLVHVIASDAHDLNSRPFKLREVYDLVSETWGAERARKLFYTNPDKILKAEDVDIGEPKEIDLGDSLTLREKLARFMKKMKS